jgi:hypothetical protein
MPFDTITNPLAPAARLRYPAAMPFDTITNPAHYE